MAAFYGGESPAVDPRSAMKPSRRSTDRPIHVRFQDAADHRLLKGKFPQRLRCGFAEDCEMRLPEGTGPDVLFELCRDGSTLKFSTEIPPDELKNFVTVAVDGKTIEEPERHLRRGSQLDVTDKSGNRLYSLVADVLTPWYIRRQFLAVAMLLLTVVGSGYAGYVYTVLKQAQMQLVSAEQRLARAEADVQRTQSRVTDTLRRLESTENQLSGAISELQLLQEASNRDIRVEFDRRLNEINARARENLARLSEEDTRTREQLEQETRERIASLREDFSSKMVDTYKNFKDLEGRLFESVKSQIKSQEPEGELYKRILETASRSVVFIHTQYKVEITRSNEISEYNSFGTGFLIAEDGLGLTAQHVLFPWRYEREFLMLKELGLVKYVPDSVRWSVWRTGSTVMDESKDEKEISSETGYRSDQDEKGLRFLYSPKINISEELASTPAGMVMVPVPVPDGSDVAVFQIMDFDTRFERLELAESKTEPLDDVLAVGYPFSRLREGVAIPQAVRGFVRVVGPQVMELDTPLHPGLSGGPIVNRVGQVVGMAMAVFQSDVYGLAVHTRGLNKAIEQALLTVRKEEQKLADMGCDPGKIDGHIDRKAHSAFICEKQKNLASAKSGPKEPSRNEPAPVEKESPQMAPSDLPPPASRNAETAAKRLPADRI
ncbi:MAG TPA: trypsin-like peptidase domain-containing protein [Gammaproteobacteria bacterium]|nr:trypsin-like peptidase domain-containing protein [Gammaproteobacteria bacterium]